MWMMPLHLRVYQKSDYGDLMNLPYPGSGCGLICSINLKEIYQTVWISFHNPLHLLPNLNISSYCFKSYVSLNCS